MLLLKDFNLKGITYQNELLINITSSNLKGITYQNELLIIITSSSVGKNYDQSVDSDIKRYKQIRKLTTGQGED